MIIMKSQVDIWHCQPYYNEGAVDESTQPELNILLLNRSKARERDQIKIYINSVFRLCFLADCNILFKIRIKVRGITKLNLILDILHTLPF